MLRDIYLFTNGILVSFGEDRNQDQRFCGPFTERMKKEILENLGVGARITFARWRAGFFELTPEEFEQVTLEREVIQLRFKVEPRDVESKDVGEKNETSGSN